MTACASAPAAETWRRIREARPRLAPRARVERFAARSGIWYVVSDASTGEQCRIEAPAYAFVGRCDGRRTAEGIREAVRAEGDEAAADTAALTEVIGELARRGLLLFEPAVDAESLFERGPRPPPGAGEDPGEPGLQLLLAEPVGWRRHLARLAGLLFARAAFWLWILFVSAVFLHAADHHAKFVEYWNAHGAGSRFLVLALIACPLVWAFAEAVQMLAALHWGGGRRVPRLLPLAPAPTSAADQGIGGRAAGSRERALVHAARPMAEVFVAAAAALFFLASRGGWTADGAYAVMAVALASAVLLDGNPLLRGDGYAALSEWLGLPDLAQRSRAWWLGRVRRMVSPREERGAHSPRPGEMPWVALHAPVSWALRAGVAVLAIAWLGEASLGLALLAGLVLGYLLLVRPLAAALHYLWSSPSFAPRRRRVRADLAVSLAVAGIALVLVPLPDVRVAEGVVAPPPEARLVAPADGVLVRLVAADGATVARGDALLAIAVPGREAGDVLVRAGVPGTVAYPAHLAAGRRVAAGALLGYVVGDAEPVLRVAVQRRDLDYVTDGAARVEVWSADGRALSAAGEVTAHAPSAAYVLPAAGFRETPGRTLVPAAPPRTFHPVHHVTVRLSGAQRPRPGTRIRVRFDRGTRPLLSQCSGAVYRWLAARLAL